MSAVLQACQGFSRTDADESLVARFQRGEVEVFDLLFQRYQVYVYNICLGLLEDPDEAEDATQDTFLRAYRSLDHFRGRATFKTWLYRIAVNTTRQREKQRRRRDGEFGMGRPSPWPGFLRCSPRREARRQQFPVSPRTARDGCCAGNTGSPPGGPGPFLDVPGGGNGKARREGKHHPIGGGEVRLHRPAFLPSSPGRKGEAEPVQAAPLSPPPPEGEKGRGGYRLPAVLRRRYLKAAPRARARD